VRSGSETLTHRLIQIQQKAHQDMLHGTPVFASGGIYGSRSAVRCIQGVKHRRIIFHAGVGSVQIQ
jgi:hypothetical protein